MLIGMTVIARTWAKKGRFCSQMKEGSSGAFRAHNLKDLRLLKAKRGLKSSELDQGMNAVILC